jgi:hypothetical protein
MSDTTYTEIENKWSFRSRQSNVMFEGPLCLYWEISGDPISDDYTSDEISADDLLRMWVQRYSPDVRAEAMYGPGMVRISWFVQGPSQFESAPFAADCYTTPEAYHDFLTYFSWPADVATGELLNWNRIPVIDKLWNDRRSEKGGFFQQATGWKPSPLQPAVYLPGVLAAAGHSGLVEYEPRLVSD